MVNASGKVTFTPVVDLHFTGARNGQKYHLKAYEPIEIAPSEVVHLDPKDLHLGIVKKPEWRPKQSAE